MSAKKGGRETALDMLRSLAVVFAIVLPLWYFGQPSPSDSKRIRPVDPKPALAGFVQDTRAPAPREAPAGWVVTVATGGPGQVRVGYVITDGSGERYLEFAGGSGPGFLEQASGRARERGSVLVAGVAWRRYETSDGRESLVRTVNGTTVLVGGVRETATSEELQRLAAAVR